MTSKNKKKLIKSFQKMFVQIVGHKNLLGNFYFLIYQIISRYSQNLFVLLCLNCSGIHRKMGSNVSRIKSLKLDINNPQCIEFF